MGLRPGNEQQLAKYQRRNRFNIIKRNWEYLPNKQLCQLLGMTREELEEFLAQDVAFLHIVGPKPECRSVKLDELIEDESHSRFIRKTLESHVGEDLNIVGEERFRFIEELSNLHIESRRVPDSKATSGEIDLAEGWILSLPTEAGLILEKAARDFRSYIASVMEGDLQMASGRRSQTASEKILQIRIREGGGLDSGTHRIEIGTSRILIEAGDAASAQQGLYFLEELLEKRGAPFLPSGLRIERKAVLSPRIIFPYFARFGDALLDSEFKSYYPEGYLRRISHMGINGIWLSGVLKDLIPSGVFPEFGRKSELQLKNLNWLVEQAGKVGLGVFLYMNEPRGMPEEFFQKHPEIKGAKGRKGSGRFALCTSTEKVQRYLTEGMGRLFSSAPGLAGVILITASENLTNCYSLGRDISCPRCLGRKPFEVVAEVIEVISRGIRKVQPSAEVVVWDWSWPIIEDDPQANLISLLPSDVSLMVDFERGSQIERGGIDNIVNEYCLSVPGPSPRAAAHLKLAREKGMKRMAKIQLSTTWECGSIPFIPVLPLLGKKFENMIDHEVQGAMESWTLGSYPSVNSDLARHYYWSTDLSLEESMRQVAAARYGEEASLQIVQSWKIFSQAFGRYPFSNSVVYSSQVPYGPAHPLYFFETGRPPTLQNTRDSLKWTQPFGPDIVADQFLQMAEKWEEGLEIFRSALDKVPPVRIPEARKDFGVARALFLHYKSVANQIRFLQKRDRLESSSDSSWTEAEIETLKKIVAEEQELAVELFPICKADSTIGFEAFFQYIYRPHDLLEKIVNCQHILDNLLPQSK